MAREIVMPQLGIAMEAGRVVRWLKQTGDSVSRGDILLEVESDKAVVEVEAVAEGQLIVTGGPAGSDVKVGTVIGYLVARGEAAPDLPAAAALGPGGGEPAPGAAVGEATARRLDTPADGTIPRLRSSPAARRLAGELGVDWRLAHGTGPAGRIKTRDITRFVASHHAPSPHTTPAGPSTAVREDFAPRISPLARELVDSLGIDLAVLAACCPNRRIEREDVLAVVRGWLQARPTHGAADLEVRDLTDPVASMCQPAHRDPGLSRVALRGPGLPLTGLRRSIAERMSHSRQTTAAVTLTTEADASELVRLREALKAQRVAPEQPGRPSSPPSYNILLARLVAAALALHPELNASLHDDEIIRWEVVNMGIAVDTERGLVVPVLRDVAHKSLSQLACEADELLSRARAGKATPDDLTGGTFTLTNLGAYEIDAFTPIINTPECAILGVGRLRRSAIIDDAGVVSACTMLALSLTFDHRLVDGAPAARFLQLVKHYVEQPYLWLAS